MGESMRTCGAILAGFVSLGAALASCTSFSEDTTITDAGTEAGTGTDAAAGDASTVSSYASIVLGDTPLLYWRLGEANGSRAVDGTANGRDGEHETSGVRVGQPSLLANDPDPSVRITAGASIARKADPGLSFSSNKAFAVECWFKLPSIPTGTRALVARMQENGALLSGYSLRLEKDGKVYFGRGETTMVSFASIGAVTADVPHHVVGVYDGKAIRLYLDGAEQGFSNHAQALQEHELDFTVGRFATGAPELDAFVDEVAVYGYALPADRVRAHYRAGSGR
ncbi:MAG: LamG domain-containing protein [Deltaproteobacteria bacterium]|nr:LamG domain-containing protein [Deltaproteobacteria bacterium]